MRAAITLFVAALLCVAIAWWVSLLPGSVTATISGTAIEASTPVAITLLAILFVLLYLLIRLLAGLLSLPRRVGGWRSGRSRVRGELAVNRALIALAANDGGAARREADRGRRLLGDTPLTLLLAAQAGRQAGREDEAAALYELLAERDDARLLGLRGLLRLAVDRQDWDRATAVAAEAEKVHPGAAWLREERRLVAQQTGQWQEALRLSGPDTKAALALAAAEHETDPKAALAFAQTAWEAEPTLAPAAIAYARRLREAGRDRQAHDVLRHAWSARPHPDLAEAYVEGADDKLARVREMANLVRSNPAHAEAQLAAAQAALHAGLTGEARRQIEAAREAGLNERRLWTLLAEVETMEGNAEAAQAARNHLPDADPDPRWRCSVCGAQYRPLAPRLRHVPLDRVDPVAPTRRPSCDRDPPAPAAARC